MTNPVTAWPFRTLKPDTDGPKLDQNFQALIDWAMTGAVHTHHIQVITFSVSLQVGGNSTEYGPFTYVVPFQSSVQPWVLCSLNSVNATRPAAMAGGIISAFDVNNLTTKAVVFNSTGTTFGSGITGVLAVIDPDYTIET